MPCIGRLVPDFGMHAALSVRLAAYEIVLLLCSWLAASPMLEAMTRRVHGQQRNHQSRDAGAVKAHHIVEGRRKARTVRYAGMARPRAEIGSDSVLYLPEPSVYLSRGFPFLHLCPGDLQGLTMEAFLEFDLVAIFDQEAARSSDGGAVSTAGTFMNDDDRAEPETNVRQSGTPQPTDSVVIEEEKETCEDKETRETRLAVRQQSTRQITPFPNDEDDANEEAASCHEHPPASASAGGDLAAQHARPADENDHGSVLATGQKRRRADDGQKSGRLTRCVPGLDAPARLTVAGFGLLSSMTRKR